ncbi:MAG: Ig-like domain-containing protein, partial [Lachnospiraceae bacterium]
MKRKFGKDNSERLETGKTAQRKYGKNQEERKKEGKRKLQTSRKKQKENQREKVRLCAALSLGAGTILFSAWSFYGNEPAYINASGYMAFQKATGQSASDGVLVSEKKDEKGLWNEKNDAAEKIVQSETESETESDTEEEKESGSERKAETATEKETERKQEEKTVMETDTEAELGAEMEITVESEGTEGESETYPVTELPTETEPSSDEESEKKAGEEGKTGSECQMESETEIITEGITEKETESSTGKMPSAGEESETEHETELTPEGITEYVTEKGTEEESSEEKESETESETDSQRGSETETITENETDSESELETATEGVGETESEPDTETETRPQKSETERQKESESETETKGEPETKARPEEETESESETKAAALEESETRPSVPEPLPVHRGEQYDIRGDENAWYRDDAGHLWVRKGSGVYVDPAKRQGYTDGGGVTDVQQDGMLTFQLKKTDADGNVIGISTLQQEAYFVDGEVPEARIEPSGSLENGVVYAAQSADVTVTVPPDGKSGLKRVSYRISNGAGEDNPSSQEETWTDWTECRGSEQINISGEGLYRVYVRTEDRVGNLAFSSSAPICVDCTPPQIEIEGVQSDTANSGSVPIRVKCSDSFYRPGSLAVKIVGANNGKVPKIKSSEEKEKSASTEFFDFPREQTYDDAYRLEVKAEDLAGNVTQKILDFSINRFGSVYDLSGETKEVLQPYYLTEASDIVFLEMNIDYVGESEIFCRENGELKKLNRGSDYTVELQGSSDSWKQYRYTIPAKYFEKEGVYELLLASRDRAHNESDTGLQGKQVTFALDWTAPECLITGVESLGIYPVEHQTACIQPKDNLGISQTRVYCDSELVQTAEGDGVPVKLKLDAKQ